MRTCSRGKQAPARKKKKSHEQARSAAKAAHATFSYSDRIVLFLERPYEQRTRQTASTLRRADTLLQKSAAALHRTAVAFSLAHALPESRTVRPASFVF